MPTNKRNDEVGKSFAIGTKIEYDEDDKYNAVTLYCGIKNAV